MQKRCIPWSLCLHGHHEAATRLPHLYDYWSTSDRLHYFLEHYSPLCLVTNITFRSMALPWAHVWLPLILIFSWLILKNQFYNVPSLIIPLYGREMFLLNSFHNTIKFAEWSREPATFLDTRVFIRDGALWTDFISKIHTLSNTFQPKAAIPDTVKHPFPLAKPFDCIVYAHQTMTLSNESAYYIIRCSYKHTFVDQQINHVDRISRDTSLIPKSPMRNSTRVPLVVTFHPNLPKLSAMAKSLFLMLHSTPHLQRVFTPLLA